MEQPSSISNFKKIVFRLFAPCLLALAVAFVIIDVLAERYLIFATATSGAYKIERIFNEQNPNEVPIFGSSRAAGSYVPELIHPNAFNYGIEKTQYDMIRILLTEELKKKKNGPIIVNFDLEFFDSWYGDQSHFIPHQDIPEIREYSKKNYRYFYNIPAVRYFGVWETYFNAYRVSRKGHDHISKGGWFLKKKISPENFKMQVEKRLNTPGVWKAPAAKSEDWLELLASTKRKIFVVTAPYHTSYYRSFQNLLEAEAFMDRMNMLPNVEVMDLGKLPLTDEHFKNTTHINYSGACIFSETLKNLIAEK